MGERKRLGWRCRRGLLELDLLLGAFLETDYARLDDRGREILERLLDWNDQELLEHLLGLKQAQDKEVQDVIRQVRRAAAP